MDMRVRLPELFNEHDLSPYAVSKQSGGRISMSTIYRLNRLRGRVQNFDNEMLEALCDVFGLKSMDDLLERDRPKRSR